MYDGVADSDIVGGIYKNARIKVRDKGFLVRRDPVGQPGAPAVPGASVLPAFVISVSTAEAGAVLAPQPHSAVTVVGTAHKSALGLMTERALGVHIEATSVTPVSAAVPSASGPAAPPRRARRPLDALRRSR